jgi:hypothetical protein
MIQFGVGGEEAMDDLLIDYIKATTNLYGVIHKDKFREIYNAQNEEHISDAELRQLLKRQKQSLLMDHYITIQGENFVCLAVNAQETYESIIKIQKGKPHYIPEREELLKYKDRDYFEVNSEYDELLKFLKTRFLRKSEAVEFSKEIQFCCRSLITFHDLMGYYWEKHRFNIRNRLKAQEFLFLLMNLRYNTRAWELNGHTAVELIGIVDDKEIKYLMSYGL